MVCTGCLLTVFFFFNFINMLSVNSSWPQPARIKGLLVIYIGEGIMFCSNCTLLQSFTAGFTEGPADLL